MMYQNMTDNDTPHQMFDNDNKRNTHNKKTTADGKTLSHLDASGDIHMVDVSDKTPTTRVARAIGRVRFMPDIYAAIKATDGMTKKGSIAQIAHIAGIMAAKRTHELIPLCHALPLDKVHLQIDFNDALCAFEVQSEVKVTHKTGVEMEALTAVSVACLTIYDMTKALSHDIVIDAVQLLHKTGGKSDYVSGEAPSNTVPSNTASSTQEAL